MRVRLSVFLLLDKQNLVKKKENNKHQRYTQAPLLYVLPFFRSTTFWRHFWSTFVWKNTAKFDINFLFIIYLWNQRKSMGVLMLLINNLNVKVSERGNQERHKHKTQINRLLKQCNCVTKSTCLPFVYSKSFPRPEDYSLHEKRGSNFFFDGCIIEKCPYLWIVLTRVWLFYRDREGFGWCSTWGWFRCD